MVDGELKLRKNLSMKRLGLVGLGVMGRNFAKNFIRNGIEVVGYDQDQKLIQQLSLEFQNELFVPATSLRQLIDQLKPPRLIFLLVPAGDTVDKIIEELLPFLKSDDILIDCGNSHFTDTERRYTYLLGKGIHFVGMGVSGGVKGALLGPALMPGGEETVFDLLKPLLETISAKSHYGPSVAYMGRRSAGHFVKMVHNGIEYALIESLAEAYDAMRHILGLSTFEIAEIFSSWSNELFGGYLLSTSVAALKLIDPHRQCPLVDSVLDVARHKGTGLWAAQFALEQELPSYSMVSALLSRFASAQKEYRVAIAKKTKTGSEPIKNVHLTHQTLDKVKASLNFAFLVSFIEGLMMIETASKNFNYGTQLLNVLKVWRVGSIVESNVIDVFIDVLNKLPAIHAYEFLAYDETLQMLKQNFEGALEFSNLAKASDVPTPTIDSALNFFLAMKREFLPAAFIQLIRDSFGYHGFEKYDAKGVFHIDTL